MTRAQLKRGRGYAIGAIVAVAAVLTPPDIMSQILLAVPLYLLYEFAIVAIWFTERRRAAEPVEASAE